ncbi:MAG: hypothetical protein HYS15_02400 [Candidatus Spechtbacteria bacterium]|nr:hypothetical protein [Candidatus Spechtbacteria bacterium]
MKNIKKSILFLIAATSLVLMPYVAFAQFGKGPPDECKIAKEMTAGAWRVQHSLNTPDQVFTLYRDMNGDGAFSDIPDERIIAGNTFPIGATSKESITIPRDALADQVNVNVKKGDTLPPRWGTFCLINMANNIANWIFFILLTIAFVFIAFAGFKWMTSKDNATAQKEAGQMIFVALVGLIIAALAKVIPAVIAGILT